MAGPVAGPVVGPGPVPGALVVDRLSWRPYGRHEPTLRDLVAGSLVERGGVVDLADLRRRADRVLGALADAGFVVAPRQPALARRPA